MEVNSSLFPQVTFNLFTPPINSGDTQPRWIARHGHQRVAGFSTTLKMKKKGDIKLCILSDPCDVYFHIHAFIVSFENGGSCARSCVAFACCLMRSPCFIFKQIQKEARKRVADYFIPKSTPREGNGQSGTTVTKPFSFYSIRIRCRTVLVYEQWSRGEDYFFFLILSKMGLETNTSVTDLNMVVLCVCVCTSEVSHILCTYWHSTLFMITAAKHTPQTKKLKSYIFNQMLYFSTKKIVKLGIS